ncbi:MAG: metallophosphoesterase [Candidatus Nanohaloarchaeota archaeon QJJ-9]|nr:metallophosphoesterase [Candidatus Nanohaloarchaeota archaeon QJJ-9]
MIFERFEVVDSKPALYDSVSDSLILSDLHLGIEMVGVRSGVLMPKFQLDEVLEEIKEMVEDTNASRLVVVGDIKQSFSSGMDRERDEVERFLDKVSMLFEEVLLVKGNHDNALKYRVEDYRNVELSEYFLEKDVLFFHGHERLERGEMVDFDVMVIGHEHPAITLKDEVGVKEKVACFLYGESRGRKIVAMPAFSKLAEGSTVNEIPEKELLSPVLREDVNMDGLEVLAVDREAGKFDFATLGELRSLD